ncbi:hypothetical protein ABZX43_07845 [Streptomyces albogriseolus]
MEIEGEHRAEHSGDRDDGEERESAEQDVHPGPHGQAHGVGEPPRPPPYF